MKAIASPAFHRRRPLPTNRHAKMRKLCNIWKMALHKVLADGVKIATLRTLQRPKWSQEKLAEVADVSPRMIQMLEAGKQQTTIGLVAKVAIALGVDVETLIVQLPGPSAEAREIDVLVRGASAAPPPPQPLLGIVHLGQLDKSILARDAVAQELLDTLKTRTRMISIVAPAGFGKTALIVRTIQKALVGDDLERLNGSEVERSNLVAQAGLKGIAVLNAAENPPLRLADFSASLALVLGQQRHVAEDAEGKSLHQFLDVLSRAGKLWIVVENAERCFSDNIEPELRSMLDGWCAGVHEAKLILLSRFELSFPPACHATSPAIAFALSDGLPAAAAIVLLRRNLRASRFQKAKETVLREIVQRLHRMPIAIEAFAGYLNAREAYINALDLKFVQSQDLLLLFQNGQTERFFFQIIKEQLAMLDSDSLLLFRVVLWADRPVPRAGMIAVQAACGSGDDTALTRLERSNLLVSSADTNSSGFSMHALIRAAATEAAQQSSEVPFELEIVTKALYVTGMGPAEHSFEDIYALRKLSERGLRQLVDVEGRGDLEEKLTWVLTIIGDAFIGQGRLTEAEKALTEAVRRLRALIDKGRVELYEQLVVALASSGSLFFNQGRITEAEKALDEALRGLRPLVESERGNFDEFLAMAVTGLGAIFLTQGRLTEAENALTEAVMRLRGLLEGGRTDLEEKLAIALSNMGSVLDKNGRLTEAEKALTEAVMRLRSLVDSGRDDLEGFLAEALSGRGSVFFTQGRTVEAETALTEAVRRLRVLVEGGRAEMESKLAGTVLNLGGVFFRQGHLTEAEKALTEAVTRLRGLLDGGRGDVESLLAAALDGLGVVSLSQGRMAEGKDALDEAAKRLRVLVDGGRGDLEEKLAITFTNMSGIFLNYGLLDNGHPLLAEAVRRLRVLVDGGRTDLEDKLAVALVNRGACSIDRVPRPCHACS